jgi:hypothetical protein
MLLLLLLREIEGQLQLVVVRRLPPMNFGVAWLAQGDQIARQLLKHSDIGEVMDLSRAPLAAFLAGMASALQMNSRRSRQNAEPSGW